MLCYLTFHSNHPIIKDDGVLSVFLTETSFEEWRKHTSVSLDEESASKRIERAEEMGIPSDLEDKITYVSLLSSYVILNCLQNNPSSGESFNRAVAADMHTIGKDHQEA